MQDSQSNRSVDKSAPESKTENDWLLTFLTGSSSPAVAQQVLLDLAPRGSFDGVYFLLMNACVPLFEPGVLIHWFFWLYTGLNIVCFAFAGFCTRNWASQVWAEPARAAVRLTAIKICQNLSLGCFTAWAFWQFGINTVTSLATLALIAFAVGIIVSLRPSIVISRIALLCCLLPGILVGATLGGRAGFGTAVILGGDILFLWTYGITENSHYWRAFRQARELMHAHRKATQEGARFGDALLSNAARHSAIVSERNRIAFEWHDTLLAGFSAISLQLDEAKRRQREAPETAPDVIELAANMVQHYRAEARLAISDLLSEDNEPLDLIASVGKSASQIDGLSHADFKISTSGNTVPLAPEVVRQLCRICQEGLINAVRHGNPGQIRLCFDFGPSEISVTLTDNGCGFAPLAVSPGHFGLHIMKQRARRLGGDLSIESSPGTGTVLSVTIPYSMDFNMTPTRILVIEDQYFSRLALHTVVDRNPDMQIVAEADNAQTGLALFQSNSPDVVIVDLKLPDQSGIELIKGIRRIDPLARIVVFSNFEGSEYLYRATEAGAMAYLTKDSSAEELCTAIRAVRVGQSFIPPSLLHLLENRVSGNDLTLREHSVLQLLVLGWSNKRIADHLGIAEKTVRIHLSSVFSKLGAANRTQAVLIALQNGFVDTPLDGRGESSPSQAIAADSAAGST